MKKTIKIVLFLLVILLCINTFTFAIDNPDFYEPGNLDSTDSNKVIDVTVKILRYVRFAGIILAIIILSVIGFKFMINSAEEKAKYMESLLPYLIGCVLLVSATFIPQIVASVSNGGSTGSLSLEDAADAAYAQYEEIESLEDLSSWTNEQLKSAWSTQWVGDDMKSYMTVDPRSGVKGTALSKTEAYNKLSDYKKKIYSECEKRGLIASDGYSLK